MISFIAGAFLVISVISLVVQTVALFRITHSAGRIRGPAYSGIVRTATCRVVASVLYTGLGVVTLVDEATVGTLLVFGFVQVMWQVNALADIRLRHTLATNPTGGRHRRRT